MEGNYNLIPETVLFFFLVSFQYIPFTTRKIGAENYLNLKKYSQMVDSISE